MCFGSYLTPGNHVTVLWCLFGVFALFGGCRNGLYEILTEISVATTHVGTYIFDPVL